MLEFFIIPTVFAICYWFYNSDLFLSTTKFLTEFAVKSTMKMSMNEILLNLQKFLQIASCVMCLIDIIGLWALIRAVNNQYYEFVLLIVWTELAEKIVSNLVMPVEKNGYILGFTAVKVIIGIYFSKPISVFSSTCKFIGIISINHVFDKVKYDLLKTEFCSFADNIHLLKDDFFATLEEKLQELQNKAVTLEIKNAVLDMCDKITNVLDGVKFSLNTIIKEYSSKSNFTLWFKIMFSIGLLGFLDWSNNTSGFIVFTLVVKIWMNLLSEPIYSLMQNTFCELGEKMNTLKKYCSGVKFSVRLISFATTKLKV